MRTGKNIPNGYTQTTYGWQLPDEDEFPNYRTGAIVPVMDPQTAGTFAMVNFEVKVMHYIREIHKRPFVCRCMTPPATNARRNVTTDSHAGMPRATVDSGSRQTATTLILFVPHLLFTSITMHAFLQLPFRKQALEAVRATWNGQGVLARRDDDHVIFVCP